MEPVALLAFGSPALVLIGYVWLTRRARRRGVGHSFLSPFEDMWDPAQRRTEAVMEERAEAGAPGPSSGGGRPPG